MCSQMSMVELDGSDQSDAESLSLKVDVILREVSDVIAPVWPLKDYVAVNPYFGLADRSFMSARAFLRVFSACETLMPLGYYAAEYRAGRFGEADVAEALNEIEWPTTLPPVDTGHIIQLLERTDRLGLAADTSLSEGSQPIRTLADHAAMISAVNFREIITDELCKFCSAHYDEDQASWGSNWKHLPLYQAWREIAQIDCNAEVLGLKNMRTLVASLSDDPRVAVADLLGRMQVPYLLWSTVLLSQVFSLPGWCAWAKYQDQQCETTATAQTLCGLLAMRLAYDYAVGQTLGLAIDWQAYLQDGCASFQCEAATDRTNAWIRYALLCATEVRYRRELLDSLLDHEPQRIKPTVQMVFCIDVRSERIRRHIESHASNIETLGFAGFFGVPMEYLPLGESQATDQLPVLLKPQFCIHEQLVHASDADEVQVIDRRIKIRTWRKLWQLFKSSSIGSFGFVESSGLWAGWQMIRQMFRMGGRAHHHSDGVRAADQGLRPDVYANEAGLKLEQQIDLAARILGNLGLTQDFARVVVLCGHHSQTNNNPLAAGLDCGACGGHSGAPNARWLALVLNKTDVRLGLCQRGIVIPPDTHFAAAAHNTTTDEIEFFEQEDVPQSHHVIFQSLRSTCRNAAQASARERLQQSEHTQEEVFRRATDWSEIRPEWGLAGNAALIVGPRSLTRALDLNAQTFLHSYDSSLDPSGHVLEAIMTAPMIVANWINMQYYASTVDNRHFGSGSKAIHNVVGKFGILSGNSGDLQTGLPLQSLHDGTRFQHKPQRLLVVICAPRTSIERVYQKHELVANLVDNQWLSIVAVEELGRFKLCPTGLWQEVDR